MPAATTTASRNTSTKVPIGRAAVMRRIHRALPGTQRLRQTRAGSPAQERLGKFYLEERGTRIPIRDHLDLEDYARELGVLAPGEGLE